MFTYPSNNFPQREECSSYLVVSLITLVQGICCQACSSLPQSFKLRGDVVVSFSQESSFFLVMGTSTSSPLQFLCLFQDAVVLRASQEVFGACGFFSQVGLQVKEPHHCNTLAELVLIRVLLSPPSLHPTGIIMYNKSDRFPL